MDLLLAEIFRARTTELLSTYGFKNIAMSGVTRHSDWYSKSDAVGVMMEVSGTVPGLVALVVDKPLVGSFTVKMCGEEVGTEDADYLFDIMGEFLNVLLGVLRGEFLGRSIPVDFSHAISLGEGSVNLKLPEGLPAVLMTFSYEGGKFYLLVALKGGVSAK